MLHHRMTEADRFEADGKLTHGVQMIGDDHVVRWFSHAELAEMQGVGDYRGSFGYAVYEDKTPASDEILPANTSRATMPYVH